MKEETLSKRELQLKALRKVITAIHNELQLKRIHGRHIRFDTTDKAVNDFMKETEGVFHL